MKKITAILCTLAMLLSLAVTVTAADNGITLSIDKTSNGVYTVKAKANTSEIADFAYMDFNITASGSGSTPYLQIDGASGFTVRPTGNTDKPYKVSPESGTAKIGTTTETPLFTVKLLSHGSGKFEMNAEAYAGSGSVTTTIGVTPPADLSYEYTADYKPFKVNIDFNNNLASGKNVDYTKMHVTVDGGMLTEPITKYLSTENPTDVTDITPTFDTAGSKLKSITVTIKDGSNDLETGQNYTVKVEGDGYRTAEKSVFHDPSGDSTTVNFWNNVFDKAADAPDGAGGATKNFLAGDIQMDGNIGLYDLNAVTSYYGFEPSESNGYIQYDLNRDCKIDAADIALVLVSWGE